MRDYSSLEGKSFNRLKVLEVLDKWKGRHRLASCVCTCGKVITVGIHYVLNGNTKSCGCYRREKRISQLEVYRKTRGPAHSLPKGEAAINFLLRSYTYRAKKLGVSFELTRDQFKSFIFDSCHYCGQVPSRSTVRYDFNGNILYNGIDRKENELGYSLNNCVSCCSDCNYLKKDRSYGCFLDKIRQIYETSIVCGQGTRSTSETQKRE